MLIHTLFSISCQIKAICITHDAVVSHVDLYVEMQGIFWEVCLRGAGKVLFSHEAP